MKRFVDKASKIVKNLAEKRDEALAKQEMKALRSSYITGFLHGVIHRGKVEAEGLSVNDWLMHGHKNFNQIETSISGIKRSIEEEEQIAIDAVREKGDSGV